MSTNSEDDQNEIELESLICRNANIQRNENAKFALDQYDATQAKFANLNRGSTMARISILFYCILRFYLCVITVVIYQFISTGDGNYFLIFFIPMIYNILRGSLCCLTNVCILMDPTFRLLFNVVGYLIIYFILFCIVSCGVYYNLHHLVYDNDYTILKTSQIEVNVPQREDRRSLNPLGKYEKTLVYTSHNKTQTILGFEAKMKSHERAEHFNGKGGKIKEQSFPLCSEVLYRVEGEDAHLICGFDSNDYVINLDKFNTSITGNQFDSFEWEMDGVMVNGFRQHFIYHKRNASMLEIISLSEKHFKYVYTLWAIYSSNIGTIKLKLGLFFIHRQKDFVKRVYLPLGHIINIWPMAVFSRTHVFDIILGQNISSFVNKDVSGDSDHVCAGELHGCGPRARELYHLLTGFRINGGFTHGMRDHTGIPTLKLIRYSSCICENAYGIHSFYVLKHSSHGSSSRVSLSEIKVPVKIIVLPTGFDGDINDDFKSVQTRIQRQINTLDNLWYILATCIINHYLLFWIGNIISVFMFVCIFHIIFWKLFASDMADLIVEKSATTVDEDQGLIENEEPGSLGNFAKEDQIRYDILILNNEVDDNFVMNTLIPFFNEFKGLRVLFPDRDFNAGQEIIQANASAVVSSRIYVIVGTKEFVADKFNNGFVLSSFILPVICESSQGEHHILIIKWNDENVPRQLRWIKNVTIAEWSDRLDETENLRTLRNRFNQIKAICI